MPRWKKGQSGNPAGRKPGTKHKPAVPPGTVKAAYQEVIQCFDGHVLMSEAIEDGLKKQGAIALAYMELGAKVLDRTGDVSPTVNITFKSSLDPSRLKNIKTKQVQP